ncbi:MAG: hypothetical protein ABIA93_04330 [Candidatus Woesearchaeota archaeon]
MTSAVKLREDTVERLAAMKSSSEETFDSVIERLIENREDFLIRIQRQKMRELWDNEADEAWENV